jgi:diguanylate cyclase (GGDEF)-like protein
VTDEAAPSSAAGPEPPPASGGVPLRALWLVAASGLAVAVAIGVFTAVEIAGRLDLIELVGLGALVASALAAAGLLWFVVRHTAGPLETLADCAERGRRFPSDARHLRLREVRRLAAGLGSLDEQLAERRVHLEQAHKRSVSITHFAELVQDSRDPDEIRTATATVLESSLPDGEVQVAEWAESRVRLATTWPTPPARDPAAAIPIDRCPAIQRQRVVRIEASAPLACTCRFGVPPAGAYTCIPMRAAGEVTGLVNVRTSRAAVWTHNEVMLAQSYVGFAAGALESLRVLASTHDRAVKDGLTGAYNRRFLDEYLSRRLGESARHGTPLALMLMDLDEFKQLNDTHGHAVGDQVLVEFAALVAAQIRAGDVLVRYGGEEFVLVLGATDLEGAMIVAERIREATARIELDASAPPSRVTVSIGVAATPDHATGASELLLVADRALYAAKSAGRDQVVRGARRPDDESGEDRTVEQDLTPEG